MTFDEYQKAAMTTAVYPAGDTAILYPALGLAEEAGEVAGKIAKCLRDRNGLWYEVRDVVKKELGDVLWMAAALADGFAITLDEVAELNLAKLRSRQERGVLQGSGDDR